jgi:hypothetical protein
MPNKRRLSRWLVLLAVAAATPLCAYDLMRVAGGGLIYWNNGNITMSIKLGTSPTLDDGSNYSTSALAAMAQWNPQVANVQFVGNIVAEGPATDGGDGNELVFSDTVFGKEFGTNTVAVATTYYSTIRRSNGSYRRTQADVIFNSARTWNSYRGATRPGVLDIRRVAIHELGHVLGLDHPDEAEPVQSVEAIMNSRVSNVDSLRLDDIEGAQMLYGSPVTVTRPANDAFAAAIAINLAGNTFTATGGNLNATKEAGEPNHAPGEPGGTSVWWRWTAPGAGSLQVDTRGSNFDTMLAAYTGTAVNALTQLASNDDEQPPGTAPNETRLITSIITLTVTAGTTYYFAVDGWDGETGVISLNLTLTPLAVLPTATLAAQTVTTGLGVTFAALPVSGGSYQWQVSENGGLAWTNLTDGGLYNGANTATLTITGATPASNGLRYRYVVTTPTGAGTSNAAILTVAPLVLPFPVAVAMDSAGNLLICDTSSDAVQSVTSAGVVNIFAGLAGQAGTADGTGSNARFNDPGGLTIAADGTVTVADTANATIRRITAAGVVTTLAGSTTVRGNADGTGAAATFNSPIGIAQDSTGTLFIADAQNHTIRRVTTAGAVTTLAGTAGNSGTADGTGNAARFNNPKGVAVDLSGNVYVADTTNNTIRRINPAGVVITIAGLAGVSGSSDGPGAAALFNQPTGLALAANGDVIVADTGNSAIRRVTAAGVVTTVAGLPSISGLKDGPGSVAWFNQPRGLTVAGNGDIYVADTGNAIVRRISGSTVTTLTFSQGTTSTPVTPAAPTVPTTPAPSTSSGGGGGGGGPSWWFFAMLSLVWVIRRFSYRHH